MAMAPWLPSTQPLKTKKIHYPTSDGKPMAESEQHRDQMFLTIQNLHAWFVERPEVYIGGNNFLYYVEGDPWQVVSPDCYVVFGAGRGPRELYKVWEEGGLAPDVVFEITSKKTRHTDEGKKRDLYRMLGVSEYYQFDPRGDYLNPRLKASWLENGQYTPVPILEGRLYSPLLELELVVEGNLLRFYNPLTGERLASAEELEGQMNAERRRAETETQARNEAEQRAENEIRVRNEAVQRAEREEQRAEQAEQRAQEAEARLAQLLAELESRSSSASS